MITLFITALVIGALGSMHCVGMCGPLALSLPVVAESNAGRMFYTLLYNLGRVVTYAALGAVLGVVGASFALVGYQQALSIIAGAVILLYLVWPHNKWMLISNSRVQHFFAQIRNSLGKLFSRKNYQSVFFIGLLNGLLPCGLVYMAIAGAVSTASVAKSSLFMAAFGLGTLPVMWSVAFFGSFADFKTRATIRKAYPYLMFFMACLLIVRGLGLGIPYLSPDFNAANTGTGAVIECHEIK
ncbi:MAG TPA: sulfite exporter TauE/SafE family protein [Ferruginibacter sp.]|nr:sulfite exporter TauE/SafE family protein [Ferruginibacter sp.]